LPLMMDGERLGVRTSAPHLGEHNDDLLKELGYSSAQIQELSLKKN
ncbi:MAG: CoA transferase, partial [Betaproteobacteria bacterium]|nr:CoA transferase [Betaproteobacteria bacterium]